MHHMIGRNVKDKITGFKGRVTGYVEYITGCNQMLVAPQVKDAGDHIESLWIDEQRLETIDESILSLDTTIMTGSDKSPPKR